MEAHDQLSPAPSPTVAAARYTLVVLTVLNFLNYMDRYVLSAVLETMKLDPAFHGVSKDELGYLQTAFLVTYLVVSPLAGLTGRRVTRKYLVAVGVGVWSLATVWSGLARSYPEMMAARALIGVGEASYATVAPAVLADLFAKDRRARILSIFYLATPVGSALGFVVGGYVAQLATWRHAFWVAGAPGLAFALLALTTAEPRRGAMDGVPATGGNLVSLGDGLRQLARSSAFLYVTVGTTLWVFSVGGLAFWLPTYFQEVRGLDAGAAGLAVGGVAVVSGLVGTLVGGFLGDAWARRDRAGYLKLTAIGLLLATPAAFASPFAPSVTLCLVLVFVAELLIFLNTGPLNTALVNSIPPTVREFGLGLHVVVIHLFGDAISPPILGRINEALQRRGFTLERSSAAAVAFTAVPLLASGLVLWIGARRTSRR